MTSKQNSADLFAELLAKSKTYTLEVFKRAGLEPAELDFSIFYMFRERVIHPTFLVFKRDGFYLIKTLSRRALAITELLNKLNDTLSYVGYEGSVFLSPSIPSIRLLPELSTDFTRLLIKKDLGPRLICDKGWLCVPLTRHGIMITDQVGRGASPSVAMMNAELAPEVSSIYLKMKKGGLV